MRLTTQQQELVTANLGLAYQWGRWLASKFNTIDPDDAVQTATIGLCQAAHTFDPSRGTKFCTHAVWRIRSRLEWLTRRQVKVDRRYPLADIDPDRLESKDRRATLHQQVFIEELLAVLTSRQRLVIEHLYGLNGRDQLSTRQLAEKIGYRSIQAVSLVHCQAIQRMSEHHNLQQRKAA